MLPASTALASCRSSSAAVVSRLEKTTGMALPSSLTVQRRLEGVAGLSGSEKDRVRVVSLMKAVVTVGGWLSLLVLVTEVEKEAMSVPSGVWRTPED